MDEPPLPDDAPWEVNEYRFEEPAWMRLLFSPWIGLPGGSLFLGGLFFLLAKCGGY